MMQWIEENWGELVTGALALHTLALVVVNLTPTPKDNAALAKVYRVVELAGGLMTKKVKK